MPNITREVGDTAWLAHRHSPVHGAMLTTLHTRMDAMMAQLDWLTASRVALPAAFTQVASRQVCLKPPYPPHIFATLASLYDQVKAKNPDKKRTLLPW